MSDDDNDRGTLSNHSDSFLIPVTTDGTKLLWDGNAATILGLLYEVKRFFTRSGLFQMLISVRAVSLSNGLNGKLAIEDANSVYFVNGTISAPSGTFEQPCPSSAARLTTANSSRSSSAQNRRSPRATTKFTSFLKSEEGLWWELLPVSAVSDSVTTQLRLPTLTPSTFVSREVLKTLF